MPGIQYPRIPHITQACICIAQQNDKTWQCWSGLTIHWPEYDFWPTSAHMGFLSRYNKKNQGVPSNSINLRRSCSEASLVRWYKYWQTPTVNQFVRLSRLESVLALQRNSHQSPPVTLQESRQTSRSTISHSQINSPQSVLAQRIIIKRQCPPSVVIFVSSSSIAVPGDLW